MVCENHHGSLIGIGDEVEQRMKQLVVTHADEILQAKLGED
jgi:hypothetical protein